MAFPVTTIRREHLEEAASLVRAAYEDESLIPGSPVTSGLIQLNLDHVARVRANAAVIAEAEGLDAGLLELAAIFHDIAKLDHREIQSGGVDTWHHHYRGASVAKKLILSRLGLDSQIADTAARMIDAHSDIPFIRRQWEKVYRSDLATPETEVEFALRDADAIDLLWVSGMSKIVHIRQIPGSAFYREDGGNIRKAIISARCSFLESLSVLSTDTGRRLAEGRILTVESFTDSVLEVTTLEEFEEAYDRFIAEHCDEFGSLRLQPPAQNGRATQGPMGFDLGTGR